MHNFSINMSSRWDFFKIIFFKELQKQNHLSLPALMEAEILLLFPLKSKRLQHTAGTNFY